MSDQLLSRHQVYEQIRANELARGAAEDDAAQTAARIVDRVVAAQEESS